MPLAPDLLIKQLFSLPKKVIVFTGGAGLYGRGLASQLAATGAKLILADRYVAALEAATVGKPAR